MSQFKPEDFKQYEGYIVSEVEEGLYHVQINRPKSLNAFAEYDWRAYNAILEKLDAIEDSKVIVISSNVPRAFTSGLNLKDAMSSMGNDSHLSDKQKYDKLKKHIDDFQYCVSAPARINTPTIAVLNGINYGLALDLAAACTVRIAIADAKFSIREIKIGITADMGSLQRLPKIVNNISLLNQYALTGENFGAEEALKLGYVSKVLPDLKSGVEYALELGENINGNQQWAIKGTKKCVQDIIDGQSTEQGLAYVAEYNANNIGASFVSSLPKL